MRWADSFVTKALGITGWRWTPTGIAVRGDDVYVLEFWYAEPGRAKSWLPRVRKLSADGGVSVLATVKEVPES